MSATISIGQMAKRAGVSVQTLRHYDKLGLLRPSEVTRVSGPAADAVSVA